VKVRSGSDLQEVDRLKARSADTTDATESLLQTGEKVGRKRAAQSGVKSRRNRRASAKRRKKARKLFAMEAKQEASKLPQRLVAYPQNRRSGPHSRKNQQIAIAALIIVRRRPARIGSAHSMR